MITTLVFGAALIAVGVGGYVATGKASKTALIPAYFGGVVVGLGLVGLMASSLVGVLSTLSLGVAAIGLLGTGRSLIQWARSLTGSEPARPAVRAKATMAVLCLAYLGAALL
jgi:hypothetical protein